MGCSIENLALPLDVIQCGDPLLNDAILDFVDEVLGVQKRTLGVAIVSLLVGCSVVAL